MVKRKTGDKLGDIRRAAIAEVVACGSAAASVNAIARRAGLAVGTIYRYHENKEQLLRATYLAIKQELHGAMMDAASGAKGVQAQIRAMWFATLDYSVAHPQAFLFAELIVNDTILTQADQVQITTMAQEIRGFVERAKSSGALRDMDTQAIMVLLSAPALRLGRTAALRREVPDKAHAEDVFALCWRAIVA